MAGALAQAEHGLVALAEAEHGLVVCALQWVARVLEREAAPPFSASRSIVLALAAAGSPGPGRARTLPAHRLQRCGTRAAAAR